MILRSSHDYKILLYIVLFISFTIAFISSPYADGRDSFFDRRDRFESHIRSLWPMIRRGGVSRETFISAMRYVSSPDHSVLSLLNRQAEFNTPIWEYLDKRLSKDRIARGRALLWRYRKVLDEIEAHYGVPREILVSIWGLESNYGDYLGDRHVIRSLVTLTWRGRRKDFGRTQLVSALQILDSGDIDFGKIKGSWAGAMGHTQFIPSTYLKYAVDWDGDGRRDIWHSVADSFASTAHYLSRVGWRRDAHWFGEVRLSGDFDFSDIGLESRYSLSDWKKRGVYHSYHKDFSSRPTTGSLILPAGSSGPSFIVYDNFRSIMAYNRSISYALSVGLLADILAGRGGVLQKWPRSDRLLTGSQRVELQRLLKGAGFYSGPIDGLIGPDTRMALRAWQSHVGAPADGYASLAVLHRMRQKK